MSCWEIYSALQVIFSLIGQLPMTKHQTHQKYKKNVKKNCLGVHGTARSTVIRPYITATLHTGARLKPQKYLILRICFLVKKKKKTKQRIFKSFEVKISSFKTSKIRYNHTALLIVLFYSHSFSRITHTSQPKQKIRFFHLCLLSSVTTSTRNIIFCG